MYFPNSSHLPHPTDDAKEAFCASSVTVAEQQYSLQVEEQTPRGTEAAQASAG